MRDKPESATDFIREAIERGRQDEKFGQVALEALVEDLTKVASEIKSKGGDAEAVAMLEHAAAAIMYLDAQVKQDELMIEALAVDLDLAKGVGDGDEKTKTGGARGA
jgi:hypothetical protein